MYTKSYFVKMKFTENLFKTLKIISNKIMRYCLKQMNEEMSHVHEKIIQEGTSIIQ